MNLSKPKLIAAVVCTGVLVGCGSSGSGSQEDSKKPVTPAATIKVTAPTGGQVIRSGSTIVRGVVTPTTASVQVAGQTARVTNGVFEAKVPLALGENPLDVIAVVSGQSPKTSTLTVTRGRSQSSIEAAVQQREAEERRQREAREKRAAARRVAERQRQAAAEAKANTPVTVPNLVGERLDVAVTEVEDANLTYREVGGGTFGIVVRSNWTVCETRPAAGSQVRKRSRVDLIVDRVC